MATWTGRGLRGSNLEEFINRTLDKYRSQNLALIQKIPTPITPIDIEKDTKHITLAYFDKKSTVDYIGVVQGIPVCFDAKECAKASFQISNIHEHQFNFMEDFEKQQGISFIIIFFTRENRMFYMPMTQIKKFYQRAQNGGRKSITFDEVVEGSYEIILDRAGFVPFLDCLQKDLLTRD
mgnify:CR=1 FL=1